MKQVFEWIPLTFTMKNNAVFISIRFKNNVITTTVSFPLCMVWAFVEWTDPSLWRGTGFFLASPFAKWTKIRRRRAVYCYCWCCSNTDVNVTDLTRNVYDTLVAWLADRRTQHLTAPGSWVIAYLSVYEEIWLKYSKCYSESRKNNTFRRKSQEIAEKSEKL